MRDEARKKSEENVRDTFQREPTPVSALFSGHGFELASEVVQKAELQKTPSLDVPAPRLSLSPSSPSSLSVPVVHKSQGGKLQVYVDVPNNASLNYYQHESMRVIPDSHMMVAIGKCLIHLVCALQSSCKYGECLHHHHRTLMYPFLPRSLQWSLTERTSLTWTHNTVCFSTSDIEYVVSWVDLASGGGLNGTTVERNLTVRTGARGCTR